MDITTRTAAILRQLRQSRGWSLTLAAEHTGVSKAMLGQIERAESSPTVATLWKIATGFNVPFSTFFSAPQPALSSSSGEMVAVPLFPYDDVLRFDLLAVILPAGALSESSPHECGVIEHVIVIEGELDIGIGHGGSWQRLETGQGLRFAGDVAHAYRNRSAAPCYFHSLIHYPQR